MKLINDLNLLLDPVQLKFNYATLSGFPGFYHAHQGIEILYIHAGTGDVFVNRQMYPILDHTLLFYQPYQLHRIRMNVTPETPYIRTKILFEPSFLDEKLTFAPSLQSFLRRVWKHEIVQPVLYDLNHSPRFVSLIEDYRDRFTRVAPSERQEASTLFLIEFFHLLKTDWETAFFGGDKSKGPHEREAHHAETIIHWLESQLHEPLDLDRMAKELHLSKHHLSRLFKRSTGNTISEYLTIIRIQKACRLLETSEKPIEQISREVGLFNTSYFCEIFKKSVNQTPLQYRIGLMKYAE